MVEKVGPGPAAAGRFKKGDEVFAMADPTRDGAYADYVAVREAELAIKPKSLHHVYAAATPVSALAAWQSLFGAGKLQPGQRILIHGGSGGVGHFAVQFAKWKGAYVIATASTNNQQLLRKLGADETIDYTIQKFEDVAQKIDIVITALLQTACICGGHGLRRCKGQSQFSDEISRKCRWSARLPLTEQLRYIGLPPQLNSGNHRSRFEPSATSLRPDGHHRVAL